MIVGLKPYPKMKDSGVTWLNWEDKDRIERMIAEEIPSRVSADTAYQNAQKHSDRQNAQKHSDRQNAQIELERALKHVMTGLMRDDSQLYKQYTDNESFNRWLKDTIFALTYEPSSTDR